ncbi:nuclear pore protein [Encephalitozoon hellem ATCC 50504]|uniref:Nuclear protein localization protein 4 n=1 Tax=Encephalitozoon hellem TaxID=27973 RepID=A0A9Q9C4L2_ENCHE|nr:nuclear pore protein [Encephalitozoon hellem ATCC 50504]AFM98601.1 nuclear pore protein [Encephalitozoon hellem ATCC 50504]UTX43545.1 NPL4 nuclear pore protein [Encephalitozoon hellem]WEL39019.1 NPL4 nuclear pore protein [Encephalitozoon hellem]|eukprot:XP_003887582.1 nuclear pore protein [Encephalitozoon hellem ATCC 50504]
MIFIVRGPEGQRRVEADESKALGPQLLAFFEVDQISISLALDGKDKLDKAQTPSTLGLRNGQVLYVEYEKKKETPKQKQDSDKSIKRERDSMLCQHDSNAMCSNCAPLDPWDEKYYKDNMIKYLSFGSYHEMMKSKKKELSADDYSVVVCLDHGSNTKCSRCQEKNIILAPQVFRMVDHVEFDGQHLVENFIRNWRESGRQRFGFLIGKYMEHEMIPLGTKAVVSGIWEPDQEDYPDGFVITGPIEDLFTGTGLGIVGMIYTDISMENGSVTSDKIIRDYFLSSLEIEFIAKMQLMHPYVLKDGGNEMEFGSRFVTIIATVDKDGNIGLQEYQVSNQCMALVKGSWILPTENPKMLLARRDILYRTKAEESMVKADPYLPGEFFIVKLTHGCKTNPLFRSTEFIPKKFGDRRMAEYFGGDFSMEKFSNFTLLARVRGMFSNWKDLFKCVCSRDRDKFKAISKSKDFRSFVSSMEKYRCTEWECKACTFVNERNTSMCEMCNGRRD